MASIFTYQEQPPRIHSPWSTPGTSTPQAAFNATGQLDTGTLAGGGIILKLEPERHDGPTEYKLHLLLRPRRKFQSMSTTTSVSGQHPILKNHRSGSSQAPEPSLDRSPTVPSSQVRQQRLHQLTTQLLWRLQQSSPFHSSSTADLILPLLPEATPRLGIPERPSKLLPGLEESQGALYEIGVADDGVLVGLVEDELKESLTNLRAMASSLGCVTKVLRRVSVGACEWTEMDTDLEDGQVTQDKLWVAEVLVYPDTRDYTSAERLDQPFGQVDALDVLHDDSRLSEQESVQQIRVTLLGATNSGKSSLLGTLSTSILDNGRGKSRLSLLKHRHEIASGVTSSVAQELVGYSTSKTEVDQVINYASGNVSSWVDIHNLSNRLVFFSDSPGNPRFAKSTFRALISWKPSWTILCLASEEEEHNRSGTKSNPRDTPEAGPIVDAIDITLSQLGICLRLQLPLIIAITKMDLASKTGLRSVLAKVLSALKAAGRKPVMLGNTNVLSLVSENGKGNNPLNTIAGADQLEIERLVLSTIDPDAKVVPIVLTSAVTGLGISRLHALLQTLSPAETSQYKDRLTAQLPRVSCLFHIDEVFSIPPSRVYSAQSSDQSQSNGAVFCGHVAVGVVRIGDVMRLGPVSLDMETTSTNHGHQIKRSHSYTTGNIPTGQISRSLASSLSQVNLSKSMGNAEHCGTYFPRVRVVSLRNLRLPVHQMQQGDTGTIGVELITDSGDYDVMPIERARRGMVLANWPVADEGFRPVGYASFAATFPGSDFALRSSPPLILGGHAIVYINSIRAAVKVIAVALHEKSRREDGAILESSRTSTDEVFTFESDEEDDENHTNASSIKDIKITFRFISTVEWMLPGDQVLVVPTLTVPGPVSGATVSNMSNIAGFVGRISECI